MRNFFIIPPPFYTGSTPPLVFSYSSQQTPTFMIEEAIDYVFPSRPWKTATNNIESVVIDVGTTMSIGALYVARTNYQQIRLYQVNGNTTTLIGPNLLQNSHYFASWSSLASVTVSDGYAPGPDPMAYYANRAQFGASGVMEEKNYGTYGPATAIRNKPFSASVWAMLNPSGATATGTLSMGLKVDATLHSNTGFSINTGGWKFLSITGTVGAGVTGPGFTLSLSANNLDILLWGAQVTIGTTKLPMTTYKTDTIGINILPNPGSQTRQSLFDLCDISLKRIKYEIPVVITDNGDMPSTGAIVPISTFTPVFGGHVYPNDEGFHPAFIRSEFEDGTTEYIKLGSHRFRFDLPQTWAMQYTRTLLYQILRLDPGKVLLYFQNIRTPGGNELLPDPTQAYLVRLTNLDQGLNFEMPELASRPLSFEEVI